MHELDQRSQTHAEPGERFLEGIRDGVVQARKGSAVFLDLQNAHGAGAYGDATPEIKGNAGVIGYDGIERISMAHSCD